MSPEECIELFERYVFGKASDQEIARLSNWIKNNPGLSRWLERQIEDSSSEIDAALQFRMLRNIHKEVEPDNAPVRSSGWKKQWWLAAAVVMLPLLTAIGMYFYMSDKTIPEKAPYTIAVEQGQKANIVLPDGSKVWLNSKSKLTCTPGFNDKDRELNLTGEAYFEVAHNKNKPFRVKCNDISVEALGTAFVVRAYGEDKTVSSVLINGKVKVGTLGGQVVLSPNERVEYDKETRTNKVKHVTNAPDFTGWRNNELRFEHETLKEIAKSIERTYNIKIVFGSNGIENQYFTGTINNGSLESVLNTLALTSSLKFRIENQQVILSKR
ncbi:MAG: FecR domain-containing protein [Bacteroidota bacterium]|nr:FecR domain-containing protein [Bacteroidota bacterium]MDP4268489.1 FecR domain-containing protein [Bacteroidota bacterium]